MSRYTGVTDEDLRQMLDAIGVGSLEDLFADIPESVRLGRELDLPQGQSEQEVLRAPVRSGRSQPAHRGGGQLPRRGDVRPLRPGADRHAPEPLGVPHAVHAVPARDLAGRAPGDVRVPDGHLGAHRAAGVERVGLRGAERGGRRRLPGEARDQARPAGGEPRPAPALARRARDPRGRIRHGGRGGAARRRRRDRRGGARRRGGRRHRSRLRAAAELPRHGGGPRGARPRPASAPARCSCARPTRSRSAS